MLIYSDSASGGLFTLVGSDNNTGQTVTNNLIERYGMQVTVDQAAGVVANQNPNANTPVVGNLILEGEGVSPVAVNPNADVDILIPYTTNVVSGNPELRRTQGITINNPTYAALANAPVGNGNVMVMYDRQPIWNNGPGSDIDERDNSEILINIIDFLSSQSEISPANGLVAHWAMDEGSGTLVSDISGNGHDATLSGASWDNNGAIGSALAFQSNSGGMALPASAFASLEREVTVSLWVRGASNQPLNNVNFRVEGTTGRILNIHIPWRDSRVYWDAGSSGGTSYDRISGEANRSLYEGDWNNWAFTKNADTGIMSIYVNGELFQTGTDRTRDLRGMVSAVLGSNYNGSMDELMIFNSELSAQEISDLFASADEAFNVAQGQVASQSSTAFGGSASRAVDGNTNSLWRNSSITHTANPSWQVNLGSPHDIYEIDLYKKIDSQELLGTLSNFTVSVIDSNGQTTYSKNFTSYPDPSLTISTGGVSGQIVRVELNGSGDLSLAEVEVEVHAIEQ